MNSQTLHQCNLDERINFADYQELLSKNDVLVFYAQSIASTKEAQLRQQFDNINLYFVSLDNPHSYGIWVKLVNRFKRTMTWK